MRETVNPDSGRAPLRRRQVARTEDRIVAAATGLFLADGYVQTTLAAVAAAAEVATRTVYVRFRTKVELFKRVLDVAIVGDGEPIDVMGRDWMDAVLSAPTRGERIAAVATLGRAIMERAGPLFAVAQEVATIEPDIAEHLRAGRKQTHEFHSVVWTRMRDDGLLDPDCDLTHVIASASILAAGETYLLVTRMLGWGPDDYEGWLRRTLACLCTGEGTPRSTADAARSPDAS